jgi:hypothetical protein
MVRAAQLARPHLTPSARMCRPSAPPPLQLDGALGWVTRVGWCSVVACAAWRGHAGPESRELRRAMDSLVGRPVDGTAAGAVGMESAAAAAAADDDDGSDDDSSFGSVHEDEEEAEDAAAAARLLRGQQRAEDAQRERERRRLSGRAAGGEEKEKETSGAVPAPGASEAPGNEDGLRFAAVTLSILFFCFVASLSLSLSLSFSAFIILWCCARCVWVARFRGPPD